MTMYQSPLKLRAHHAGTALLSRAAAGLIISPPASFVAPGLAVAPLRGGLGTSALDTWPSATRLVQPTLAELAALTPAEPRQAGWATTAADRQIKQWMMDSYVSQRAAEPVRHLVSA